MFSFLFGFYRPFFPLFSSCFVSFFFAHVVSSLFYHNLLWNKRLVVIVVVPNNCILVPAGAPSVTSVRAITKRVKIVSPGKIMTHARDVTIA
jgi:hypothetical protein